jgi:hypothetical protein
VPTVWRFNSSEVYTLCTTMVFLLRVACSMRQHWSAVDLLQDLHCIVHAVAAAIGSHSPFSAALGSAQRLSAVVVVGSADKTLEQTPPRTCQSCACGMRMDVGVYACIVYNHMHAEQ